jgi:hypothetical protein
MAELLHRLGRFSSSTFAAFTAFRPPSDDYSKELNEAQLQLMKKIAEEERASWVSNNHES